MPAGERGGPRARGRKRRGARQTEGDGYSLRCCDPARLWIRSGQIRSDPIRRDPHLTSPDLT
uniref:Uncharacterized protein n=1 Tax=Oryza rufipogon TaxID=4529 RepID=A0A0E0PGA8_ORYRU